VTLDFHDKDRYVLVARVPREIEVHLEDLFLTLPGVTRPSMGYHITLLGPFSWLREVDAETFEPIAALCRTWQPFTVTLGPLGAFLAADRNILYISASAKGQLKQLHQKLLEVLEGQITSSVPMGNAYAPHISLALDLTDEELQMLLRSLPKEHLERTFQINLIWLARQSPSGPWEYIWHHELGKTASPEHTTNEQEES